MASAARAEKAPAKINLTLHVLGRRADGYHEIESLVAFAGVGDALAFTPGAVLALAVTGPSAPAWMRAARETESISRTRSSAVRSMLTAPR